MVLLYQLFDNLDGKQARRLGLSSALGLIVDHGCDGINVVMSTFSAAALFQYGAGLGTLTTLFMATSQFFFAAWDEYYRGEFILPYVNGPNEGVMILAIMYLASAAMPNYSAFWHTRETLPFIGGSFQRCDIALVHCSASAVPVVLTHVYGVCYHLTSQRKSGWAIRHAIATVSPYCLGVGLACYWIYNSDIMSIHPRLTIWFIGLLFSYTATQIQVAHVCDGPLQPYRWPCVASVMVLLCNYLIGAVTGEPLIDEGKALQLVTYFLLLAWVLMVAGVVRDIAKALDIAVWTVPVKVQNRNKKLAND
ncbi:phosphotransferase 1 [Perkinsus chesapeaki]|uniref:Phosphotransferase 1 n=1 Tax=Perkinsus chesapeaki TaxID=330153 RepID=A0A7J6MUA3_PERCH|nr:phosphotransferase 1 [Perkinsus chesapeaki]